MTRLEVESFAGVSFITRSLREEETTRIAVHECAAGFSPRIADISTDHACVCMMDISGMERLFGKPEFPSPKNSRTNIVSWNIMRDRSQRESLCGALCCPRRKRN